MNTYLVELYRYGTKAVQAKSRSAAKYAAYKDYDVTGGLGFLEYLRWVKSVRLLHRFRASDLYEDPELFERMKLARGIPFAYIGEKVVLHSQNRGDLTGVICGANDSYNLDVCFEGTTWTENCHPKYRLTYYNDAGEVVAEF